MRNLLSPKFLATNSVTSTFLSLKISVANEDFSTSGGFIVYNKYIEPWKKHKFFVVNILIMSLQC